jgi:hypothetical protein
MLSYTSTEEDGPQFDAIRSIQIPPAAPVRLREAGRQMSDIQKIARETAGFHSEAARRHGINTHRGLAHFRAARAFNEAGSKLMEFFNQNPTQQDGGQRLDPKAQMQAHQDAADFHKKQASKKGLNSDAGAAHVELMQQHMSAARTLKGQAQKDKQQKQQAKAQQPAAQGPKGRQQPKMPIPSKSQQPSQDVRQVKPPIELQPKKKPIMASREAGDGTYVAQRYDKSHPEGFKKEYLESEEGGPGSGPHPSSGRVANDHGMGARHEKLKKALKDANSRSGVPEHLAGQARASLRLASAAIRKGDYNSAVDHHDDAAAALKRMGRYAPSEHDF